MANTWQARKKRWSQYYTDDTETVGAKKKTTGTAASTAFESPYRYSGLGGPGAGANLNTSGRNTTDPRLAQAYNALAMTAPAAPPTLPGMGSTIPGTGGVYGSLSGGGGAPGVAGGPPADPWSGFAGNYAGVATDFFDSDPQIFIRDAMKAAGFNPDDGLMALMEDKAGMLQFLSLLGAGADADSLQSVTPENYLNFINQWTKDMLTPGKGSGDVWGMVQSILDAPEGSALKAYLQDGTPQQQAEALNTLVSVATSSLPAVYRKAIGGMMEDRTNDWLSTKAKGKKNILAVFLQQGGGGLLGAR
jgi:hypothetical protein